MLLVCRSPRSDGESYQSSRLTAGWPVVGVKERDSRACALHIARSVSPPHPARHSRAKSCRFPCPLRHSLFLLTVNAPLMVLLFSHPVMEIGAPTTAGLEGSALSQTTGASGDSPPSAGPSSNGLFPTLCADGWPPYPWGRGRRRRRIHPGSKDGEGKCQHKKDSILSNLSHLPGQRPLCGWRGSS